MQSKAKTVKEYLAELPPERKAAIGAVREVILKNLPKGFAEIMQYGMIGYAVPHSVYPPGYHCDPKQPLPFVGLASQKNHMAVYMMNIYMDKETENWFIKAYKASGKKLDIGKSCLRFKKVEDLALDVIGQAVGRKSVKEYIALYEKNRK
ncbi:MAG TPA: DUF1801 domain-containing protein [candidate division Zixibacteria bacterium]|nr:DUF1801 domain-containing protein [candidate division Zixibacteria bacterium]